MAIFGNDYFTEKPGVKDFNDCLGYHNINPDNLALQAILKNPSIIGMDKDFLANKSNAHKTDLITGEYLIKLANFLAIEGSKCLKRGQWSHESPDWFDHRHHMLNPEEESKNSWLESISMVLRLLPEGGKILNYCAGDAYFDYTFFRQIAGEITCVDINNSDEYKNYLIHKHTNSPNIEYLYEDILKHEVKEDYYDIIIMRSAIEHFSEENQKLLFTKIKKGLTQTGWYCGDTPAKRVEDELEHDAHEFEWKDEDEAREVLSKSFTDVHVYSIFCNIDKRTTLFWRCR